jgi:hypothetical protein
MTGNKAIALICGAVSGNLEIIDFDCEAVAFTQWAEYVGAEDTDLFSRLVIERSPHGIHVLYRCQKAIPGNTKLAMRGKQTIIETRGQGGYCIVSPSKGYEIVQSRIEGLSVLTVEERNILIDAARACDEVIPTTIIKGYAAMNDGILLPGADYDTRGDVRAILQKHRWTAKGTGQDGRERWQRPGKNGNNHSATLTDGKIFYPFSSNAAPFESQKSYSPFAVYATLEHGGDFSAAAKALAAEGYGTSQTERANTSAGGRKPRFLNGRAMEKEFGKKVEMLWRDGIPKGNPCIFAGPPGIGKTSNVAQISKEITLANFKAWVLWVATEGFVSDHSDKWAKLHIPDRVVMLSDDKGVYKLQLDNWKDREFLDQSISALESETGGKCVAVVIDSIRGMQSMGENDPKLAGVMSAVNSLVCDKHRCACIYIAHHKKGREENRLNRVAGGTGITSSVRAVYTVEKISDLVCRIVPDKSNTLGHQASIYKSVLIETDDGFEISIVKDSDAFDDTQKSKSERFLVSLFREGTEFEAKEIYRRGATEGLSASVLKKAKSNLPIEVINSGVGTPWVWRCSLYNQNSSPSEKSMKIEEKKPNNINERHERHENLEDTPKTPRETRETRETREGNNCLPRNDSKHFSKLDPINLNLFENTKGDVSKEEVLI